MILKGYSYLTLLTLLGAATAAANQAESPAPPTLQQPAEPAAPNIPPELSNPPDPAAAKAPDLVNTPGPLTPGTAATAPTAVPSAAPHSNTIKPPPVAPTTAAQGCVTADCAPPLDKSGARAGSAKATHPAYLGPPAQRALTESRAWAENPNAMPARDAGGRVVFTFSESAPTVVCEPDHICDLQLQPGELILGTPHVGDAIRWKISPALSGSDDHKTIHLILKPTEAGLDTNLVIPTDRRTYHLRLVSSFDRYVSSVGFFYPDDAQSAAPPFGRSPAGAAGLAGVGGPGADDMPTVAASRLNFDYKIKVVKGKPLFKPLRVMDDGYHTYIAMNADMVQAEAPTLFGISSSGEEQMLNYRLKGNIYVIDGTVYKLALVTGVGSEQQRVELQRRACARRGWLGMCWDAKE